MRSNNTDLLDSLLLAVCDVTGTHPHQIRGSRRHRHVSDARHLFVYLALDHPYVKITLAALGNYLGGRLHSTILLSRIKAGDLLEYDRSFKSKYKAIQDRINTTHRVMSMDEFKTAVILKESVVTQLKQWLVDNPENPYRYKVMSDLRLAEAELMALTDQQSKNQ